MTEQPRRTWSQERRDWLSGQAHWTNDRDALADLTGPLILAVDPGTRLVGFCLANGARYLTSGYLNLGPYSTPVYDRLQVFAEWLKLAVETWQPDIVVCERPTGDHNNMLTSVRLGQSMGMVTQAAMQIGARVCEVTPSEIKSTGFSKTEDGRGAAAYLVRHATGQRRRIGEDEADAIGAWQHVLNELRLQRFELPQDGSLDESVRRVL